MMNPLVEFLFRVRSAVSHDRAHDRAAGRNRRQSGLIEVSSGAAVGRGIISAGEGHARSCWASQLITSPADRLHEDVLKGIPPQQLNGRVVDITPILEAATDNLFGPEVGPRILIDKRNQYTIDPDTENEMIHNGFVVMVHETDDDQKHPAIAHARGGRERRPAGSLQVPHAAGPHGSRSRRSDAAGDPMMGGMPGGPGGGGGQPGVAGAPRPGALPAPGGARPAQNPPGAINADQMADGAVGGRG